MGLWRGTAWLGQSAGRQQVEVRANTYSGAVQQIEKIYGGESIWDLHEVHDSGSSSSLNFADIGGSALLVGFLFLLWLIVQYWTIILPIGIIGGLIALWNWIDTD